MVALLSSAKKLQEKVHENLQEYSLIDFDTFLFDFIKLVVSNFNKFQVKISNFKISITVHRHPGIPHNLHRILPTVCEKLLARGSWKCLFGYRITAPLRYNRGRRTAQQIGKGEHRENRVVLEG